ALWQAEIMKLFGTKIEVVRSPYRQSVAPIDNDYEYPVDSVLVKGKWNNKIVEWMKQNDIKGLYLNSSEGFKSKNFDFLLDIPELELLNIISPPVDKLSVIDRLINLKSISLSCAWEDKIDLSGLHRLENCFINYAKGAESVFECSSLRCLYIDEFKLKSFAEIKNLSKIECLTIANSNFNSPELLGELKSLRKLVLLNCKKLDHLDGISNLKNLEWLTIDGSTKITNIKELSSLGNLEVLQLSDNKEIESLRPIRGMAHLRALCFFGSTVISEGDLTFLEGLPKLSLVGFAGRRHYTHKPARAWDWADYESGRDGVVRK
ncbi:hypothetical protein QQM79_21055, partial [Marinobacteraceae bacterium S3BR75-40.1]